MEDMIHVPVRFVTESLGIAPQTAAREPQRRPISRYADRGRASRSLRGLETRGTAGCCIRSKSSRFVVHSFREGNTRSQCVFFSQLCQQAGYHLDVAAFAIGNPLRQDFVQARFHCQDTGRSDRLAAVLDKAVTTAPPPGADTQEQHTRSIRDLSFPKAPGEGLVPPVQGEAGQSSRSYHRGHDQGPQSPEVGR